MLDTPKMLLQVGFNDGQVFEISAWKCCHEAHLLRDMFPLSIPAAADQYPHKNYLISFPKLRPEIITTLLTGKSSIPMWVNTAMTHKIYGIDCP